jgi:hypothetical protein
VLQRVKQHTDQNSYGVTLLFKQPIDHSSYDVTLLFKQHTDHGSYGVTLLFKQPIDHSSYDVTLLFNQHTDHSSYDVTLLFKQHTDHSSYGVTLLFKQHTYHSSYDITVLFQHLPQGLNKHRTSAVTSRISRRAQRSQSALPLVVLAWRCWKGRAMTQGNQKFTHRFGWTASWDQTYTRWRNAVGVSKNWGTSTTGSHPLPSSLCIRRRQLLSNAHLLTWPRSPKIITSILWTAIFNKCYNSSTHIHDDSGGLLPLPRRCWNVYMRKSKAVAMSATCMQRPHFIHFRRSVTNFGKTWVNSNM